MTRVPGGRVAHRGQQDPLAAGPGHVVVPGLEAEVAGQPAAAGIQHVQGGTGGIQERPVGVVAHDRVLVAAGLRARWSMPPG
jgi:hypothetical protein